MGVGGQHHAPAALPPGKTRYPSYRRLGRPQGRSGRVQKNSPPPGFDPRTVELGYLLFFTRPMKMEQTECSETSANITHKITSCSLVHLTLNDVYRVPKLCNNFLVVTSVHFASHTGHSLRSFFVWLLVLTSYIGSPQANYTRTRI